MPKQTLILDSTQIDAFLTCPQLWDYGQKQRLSPATGAPTGEAMLMGTYGHKLLELYYKAKAEGKSQVQAIGAAEEFDPDRETCECNKPEFDEYHDFTTAIAERPLDIDIKYHPFKPKPFPLEKPKRYEVLQRFREYSYTYTTNDIEPLSSAHVEVGFSHLLYEDSERVYILEGRIDNIGKISGQQVWQDHKFQLRARDLYKKSIQFRNYSLVMYETMGICTGIVNYIRLTKGITKDTFKRELTQFNGLELKLWKTELIVIFNKILDAQNSNGYKQNWSACSGKFGYPCDFTPLCEEYNADIVKAKKQQLYTVREEWKPW
jgi:hypothetical protein